MKNLSKCFQVLSLGLVMLSFAKATGSDRPSQEQSISAATAASSNILFKRVTNAPMINVSGVGSAWGDYDRDGFPDLFVGTTTGNPTQFGANKLYRNQGNGTFSAVDSERLMLDGGVIWAAWADYDNDGWLDLFGGKLNNDLLLRNNGNGTFSRITNSVTTSGGSTVGCAWSDFDNDGYLDLIAINEGAPNSVFRNDGRGSFVKLTNSILATSTASQTAEWGDYDNDGRSDLFIANYQNNRSFLYRNLGDGNFTRITNSTLTTETGRFSGASWGDYNNDGSLDLFVRTYGPRNALYQNNGDGSFTKMTTSVLTTDAAHSYGSSWGDYDNDGWLDLFVSNGGTMKRDALYRNNGDGTFSRINNAGLPNENNEGRTMEWIDYDRDGFLDLWIANTFGNQNMLYRNSGNSNHWLRVRCEGRVSNRSGFGAKVRLRATVNGKTFWQMREIHGAVLEAHFGLGEAAQAEIVRVEWPSGVIQQLTNVVSRQFLTIAEPPELKAAGSSGGKVELTLRGGKGVQYQLQTTTNFHSWSPALTITNQTGTVLFQENSATNSRAFYRVQEL